MKNTKFLQYILLVLGTILVTSCGVNSPTATNTGGASNIQTPAVSAYMSSVHGNTLTAEAINLVLAKGDLTPKQKAFLLKYRNNIEAGAIIEDDGVRPINHFWDPVHDVALSDPPMAYNISTKAIVWAKNDGQNHMYDNAKSKFIQTMPYYDPNNSYRAIDTELSSSMENLGRTLHILQDMTSPPHVRNDEHLNFTSGYENLTANYTPPTINNYAIEQIANEDVFWFYKFRELALFTNKYFLSEDTIPNTIPSPPSWRYFDNPYILPNVVIDPLTGKLTGTLGYVKGDIVNPIAKITYLPNKDKVVYELDDVVHTAYADILVPKSIEYTAGVIKYFLNLKGTGKVIIDNPMDNTTVTSPTVVISGHLTYYAASATVYYHVTGTWSRSTMVVPVTLDTATGKYVFSTVTNSTNNPLTLGTGVNKIEVVADNENVTATNGNLTITYQAGGGGGDDHDDNEEWWDDD